MGINTTPKTWTSGTLTSSDLNNEIHDLAAGLQSAWATWTPSFFNMTKGNGTIAGRYHQVGKTITYRVLFTAGSTSTFTGGELLVTLPVAIHTGYLAGSSAIGSATLLDASGGAGSRTGGVAYVASVASNAIGMITGSSVVTDAAPWTWATGDTFSITGTYESA